MTRSRKKLEMVVHLAKSRRKKAAACYQLGVFHDNNGRESKAIPCYKQALWFGLNRPAKAKALTWLSSSLHKTGNNKLALRYAEQAKNIARETVLVRFIKRLIKRIEKEIA